MQAELMREARRQRRWWRAQLTVLGIAFAAMLVIVGLAGLHHLVDVVAGILIGAMGWPLVAGEPPR